MSPIAISLTATLEAIEHFQSFCPETRAGAIRLYCRAVGLPIAAMWHLRSLYLASEEVQP